ncbi:UNVERIFIED_CONTAM: hypothetical protein FKN15_064815 [Acipenser sinensis]
MAWRAFDSPYKKVILDVKVTTWTFSNECAGNTTRDQCHKDGRSGVTSGQKQELKPDTAGQGDQMAKPRCLNTAKSHPCNQHAAPRQPIDKHSTADCNEGTWQPHGSILGQDGRLTQNFLSGPHPYVSSLVCAFFLALTPLWIVISSKHPASRTLLYSGWEPVITAMIISSIGGLILDKTVSDPNLAGIVVYTPVINEI